MIEPYALFLSCILCASISFSIGVFVGADIILKERRRK